MKCIEFKNLSAKSVDMYITGDIVGSDSDKYNESDIAPEDVKCFLEDNNAASIVNIYINSCGGSVAGGLFIYNYLNRCNKAKNVYIDGLAGSIASVIAMVGDNIYMPINTMLMIHNPLIELQGNSADLRKMADDLDKMKQSLLSIYETKLADKVNIKTISELMDNETWLNANDAAKYFNIEVLEVNRMVAKCNINDLKNYKNVPKELLNLNNVNTTDITKDELELLKLKLQLENL